MSILGIDPIPGNHPKACPESCIDSDHREIGKGVGGVIPTLKLLRGQQPRVSDQRGGPFQKLHPGIILLHSRGCSLRSWQACCKTMWDAHPSSERKASMSLPPDNYTHSSGTSLAHDSSKCVFKLLPLIKPQRPQQQDYRLEKVHAQFASFKRSNKWAVLMSHQEKGVVGFLW